MSASIAGDRFLTALLLEAGHAGSPEVTLCDTLMAQCLDALPVMLWVANAKGDVVFYNRATYQYYGPSIAPARPGGRAEALFHRDDSERRRAAHRRVLRTGLDVHVDLRAIRHDYMPRWHALRMKPLFGGTPMVAGLLITMTDIHDSRDEDCAAAPPLPRA